MKIERCYSLLTIKEVDDDKRVITGIASTPTADRMGDIVKPDGAEYKLPIPLLWQHDAGQPIGKVTKAKVTKNGIEIVAEIAKGVSAEIDRAWSLIKSGLVRGLSIGFRALDTEQIPNSWGLIFQKWEWLELSAVTIPANAEATIQSIKSIDDQLRAASGRKQQASQTPPGATGSASPSQAKGNGKMKTLQERIAALRASRETKAARLTEIMEASGDESGHITDDAARKEYDGLAKELGTLDEGLGRLEAQARAQSTAIEVRGTDGKDGAGSRGITIINKSTDPEDKFKGQSFTRVVIAKALGHLNGVPASAIAQHRWGKSNPLLVQFIKANEVAAGGELSGSWGAELVAADARFTGDFIEYLKSKTVYDKLPLREVPANVTIKGQDGTATGYWVGEGKAIPVSKADFSAVSLTPLKVAALAVITNELLRDSTPAAEQLVRDSLADASSQRIDSTFISATAASANVSPAGILNGVSAGTSAGDDADGLRTDIATLYTSFIEAKNATGLVFVMQPALAKSIQLMRNALGLPEFPGINQNGGTLEGDPVVTGDNVGSGDFILLKPSDIYKIGDSGVQVSISRDATIEMNSVPTGAALTPAAQTEDMVNMFQSESTAIKVVRSINFAKRRTGCVQFIGDAEYSHTGSP